MHIARFFSSPVSNANAANVCRLVLIEKCEAIDELTAPLINELIEKMEVHHAHTDKNGNKVRDIDIYYGFIGKID